MKNPDLRRRWPTVIILICGWLPAVLSPVLAQTSGTGTVSGRVFNPATGEYVRNAEVRLQGTARMVTTESDGSFTIPNVPAGPATVVVSYTGYENANANVNVPPGAKEPPAVSPSRPLPSPLDTLPRPYVKPTSRVSPGCNSFSFQ